jgi:hypothetical protein
MVVAVSRTRATSATCSSETLCDECKRVRTCASFDTGYPAARFALVHLGHVNFLDMLTQSRLGLLVRILRARKRVDDLPRRTVHFHA